MKRRAALISFALAMLATTGVAGAADRVYFGSGGISYANLDGSGGDELDTDGASNEAPHGIAIDPAAGKIYWSSGAGPGSQISVANLDGSGAADLPIEGVALNFPYGVAIDAAAGRIYWANYQGGATERIAFYDLDGSDKGLVNTTGATTVNPKGVALDPAAGRIYWSNENGEISYADLDGSGGADIDTTGATTSATHASGVAIDRAAGRIYWVSNKPFVPYEAFLSYAALDDSGGADLAPGPADGAFPWGVALDREAGRVYWANTTAGFGAATISFSPLLGGSSQDLDLGGAPSQAAKFPTLLKAPVATAPPKLTAGIAARPRFLICDEGGWASDMPEAQLYRAPRTITYQWLRDGEPVPHGTRPEIGVEGTGGDFACRVTATNAAGSTSQTSGTQFVCCRVSASKSKARVARVAIVKGGKARLRLRCPKGDGHCSGTLRLLPRLKPKPRVRIGSYGRDLFALGAGKKRVFKVSLNGFAKGLLSNSDNGRLRARVAGTGVQPRGIVLKKARAKPKRGKRA